MRDLYLLNYNNYNNRIVKREPGLLSYENYLCADIARGINFVPGDGIYTTVVINSKYFNVDNAPDYLLVVESGYGIIESRWFVLSATRLANGQYRLELKRDVIIDNLNIVMDEAECNIKRGYVADNDSAIYNNEGFSFNQIKKEEILLKDYTKMPWIVAYTSPTIDQSISATIPGYVDATYTSLDQDPFYKYANKTVVTDGKLEVDSKDCWYNLDEYRNCQFRVGFDDSSTKSFVSTYPPIAAVENAPLYYGRKDSGPLQNALDSNAWNWPLKEVQAETRNLLSAKDPNILYKVIPGNIENRIIKAGNKYYRYKIQNKSFDTTYPITLGSKLDRLIQGRFRKQDNTYVSDYIASIILDRTYKEQVVYHTFYRPEHGYKIVLEEIPIIEDLQISFEIKQNALNSEAPYNVICMPYSDVDIEGDTRSITKNQKLKIMQAIGSTAGVIYDIQLLPYCPIRNLIIDETKNKILLANQKVIDVYTVTGPASERKKLTSILVAQTASTEFMIHTVIPLTNKKIQNETETWRLCSPNYSGIFEFNVAKFDQSIVGFNVDVTFKPYTPYIHVAPFWSGLYGKDFNDARGLICSGDWSIDVLNNAWETYKLNNKNFQLQQDRQIESMELKHSWNMWGGAIQGASDIIGGIAGGASKGGWVGAITGGLSNTINTGFNMAEKQSLGQDSINMARDMFNYRIGNIQALPYGLTKVGVFNNNNKLFPFIEHYTSTPDEVKYLEKYIEENGMTVDRVGKIRDYHKEGCFVSASILRAETFKGTAAMLNDLNRELLMGVHIYAD